MGKRAKVTTNYSLVKDPIEDDIWVAGDMHWFWCHKLEMRQHPVVCLERCTRFLKKSCKDTYQMDRLDPAKFEKWVETYSLHKGE